uniref:Uncharacterized protein n=1 Tax=Panagrolaimus sp. ES5 TaxID=591445 RepID=A0AC34G8M2_9BILA
MKTEHQHHQNHSTRTILTPTNDRRRILAPRTSEEEALFIAKKYLENKAILEAKLANAVNGGRFLRQNMLVASTSSSSSIDLGSLTSTSNILGIDSLLGAYFNQPMFAAMASLSNVCSSNNNININNNINNNKDDEIMDEDDEISTTVPPPPPISTSAPKQPQQQARPRRQQIYRIRRRQQQQQNHRYYPCRSKIPESHILAAESFRKLCDTLLEIVPRAAKTFEDACKLQSEYFEQLKLQVSLASFASQ